MKKNVYIIVEGHADSDGTDEKKNWQISADRAVAVVNKLRSYRNLDNGRRSITWEGEQLTARAMGEFTPASVSSGQIRLNRRVEKCYTW